MRTPIYCLTALMGMLLFASIPAHADGLTARVAVVQGVPRLLINGQPIRPHIFWGGPGSSGYPIKAGRQSLSFQFSPMSSEASTGTLHLWFERKACSIVIENIHLADLTAHTDVIPLTQMGDQAAFARDWEFWPANSPDGLGVVDSVAPDAGGQGGGARFTLREPPSGKSWAPTHIYHKHNMALDLSHTYKLDITLTSDTDTTLALPFYRVKADGTHEPIASATDAFYEQIALAAKSGVNIVTFEIDEPWSKPGEPLDSSKIDDTIRFILRVNPKALIIPRLYMRAPNWWLDAHPGDEMRFVGAEKNDRMAAPSSLAFRKDAGEQFAAEIAHLEATFGDHMAGYHPAGQSTNEWFYYGSWGPDLNGYSDADTSAFRKWLTAKYGSDAALQAAWHEPAATLATAAVPAPTERTAAIQDLRDPATQQNVIDFARFQQQDMAACLCSFAHVARQATAGKKLVVVFYGYSYEFGTMNNGPANAGHYDDRQVIGSPDIDMIASPWSYHDRDLNGSEPVMTPAESITLGGKLYIGEDDTRTDRDRTQGPKSKQALMTPSDTCNMLLRNISQAGLRNFGTWWMDLARAGWFDDASYWSLLDKTATMARDVIEHPRPFAPEIASIFDETSIPYFGMRSSATIFPTLARAQLGRSGAPYGQYLEDDVEAGKVKAKAYIFFNSVAMSADERARLLSATRGAARVWCGAAGYYDSGKPSLDAMAQLTGFRLKPVALANMGATPTAAGERMGLTAFGSKSICKPAFAVADASPEEALATYADGSVAVAMRRTPTGLTFYIGPPELTPELARLIARAAGAHLYADNQAAVSANGPYLCVHATRDGPVRVDTGRTGPVVDIVSGQKLGEGPAVVLNLQTGDTRLLKQ